MFRSSRLIEGYLLCIIFQLLLPLVPLLFEFWFSKGISGKSLMISVAIYAIAIGNTSKNQLFFGITIIISLIFSTIFGLLMGGSSPLPPYSEILAAGCLIGVFLASCFERYAIYVTDKTPCWDFK